MCLNFILLNLGQDVLSFNSRLWTILSRTIGQIEVIASNAST